jgi:hypothetical protein
MNSQQREILGKLTKTRHRDSFEVDAYHGQYPYHEHKLLNELLGDITHEFRDK